MCNGLLVDTLCYDDDDNEVRVTLSRDAGCNGWYTWSLTPGCGGLALVSGMSRKYEDAIKSLNTYLTGQQCSTLCPNCNGSLECIECAGMGYHEGWDDKWGGPGVEHYTVETRWECKSCNVGRCNCCDESGHVV